MKKLLALTLCLVFVLSLTACGDTTNDVESMGESVVSSAEEKVSDVTSSINESMNQMASITANQALAAALKHAGFSESQITDKDIDLDRENGKLFYDVKFKSGDKEYEYEINAETGEVLSSKKDND